jgi:hypothetical protein
MGDALMASNMQGWVKGSRTREPAAFMNPVIDPAAWYADDISGNEGWIYTLCDAEIAETLAAVQGIVARGLDIKHITVADFPLSTLGPALREIREELMKGRGMAMIRGLPIANLDRAANAVAFWGIGCHIGRQISQNGQGHLLGHVKDLGGDYGHATTRGYLTNAQMAFHNDQCDIIALCCLSPAKSGGDHAICSSVTLYNEMLKRRPDLMQEYEFSFYRSRSGELPPGETEPWQRQLIFNFVDGYFAARGVGIAITKAQSIPGVPALTGPQKEALAMFRSLAVELSVQIPFRQGDIFCLNNHVTLHSRGAFEDWPEPDRKRHLLRLWLDTNGARPLPPEIARQSAGVIVAGTDLTVPLDAV